MTHLDIPDICRPRSGRIVGIDPGVKGAIAWVDADGAGVRDLPTERRGSKVTVDGPRLAAWLVEADPAWVVIEDVQGGNATLSKASAFSFGRTVGRIEAVVAVTRIPVEYVTPRKWCREFGLDGDKVAHIARAREYFPALADLLLSSKDGRADALLIAEWGRRTLS